MHPSQPPSLVSLLGFGSPAAGTGRREQDELFAMWSAARAEANLAYEAWRDQPGSETYWSYRAAEERADAAEDALAEACRRSSRPVGLPVAA